MNKKKVKEKEISCPHVTKTSLSVYIYDKFKGFYFMFCEKCNKTLLKQMTQQKKLEDSL